MATRVAQKKPGINKRIIIQIKINSLDLFANEF
jgi:hypothetical protein